MGYKVEFTDNKAEKAIELPKVKGMNSFVEFGDEQERTIIKFLYIEATSEAEAIRQADAVVRRIWGNVLGLND